MDLVEDLKTSLLSFNFVMIYIIHKMLLFSNTFVRNVTFKFQLRYDLHNYKMLVFLNAF